MTRKTLLLPYAMQGGAIVDVDDVERGLACKCICPSCSKPLLARKGSRIAHHFAHAVDTTCTGETVVHVLAMGILQRA